MFEAPRPGARRPAPRSAARLSSSLAAGGVERDVGLGIERGAAGRGCGAGRPSPRGCAAIGRMSPCAATRLMCSSGAACSQTVVQWREQQVEGRRVGDDAAGRGDHRLGVDLDRSPRARAARSGGRRWCRRGRGSRAMLQPASVSISRLSSTNGTSRSSASMPAEGGLAGAAQADQRDAPAARRLAPPSPNSSPSARRARRSSASLAASQQLADQQPLGRAGGHVADQLGERAVAAPARPAAGPGSRRCRCRISRLARWRSETSAPARGLARRPRAGAGARALAEAAGTDLGARRSDRGPRRPGLERQADAL